MTQVPPRRHLSLVVPILLIVFGSLFLYSNWKPAFDPWPIVFTYWPALLVLVGLGMFWDTLRRRDSPGSAGFPLGSTIGVILFVLLLFALLRHSPQFADMRSGSASLSHTRETLDRQGATALRATLKLGAGQITLRGGATHLFEGNFEFGPSYQKPRVEYQVSEGTGDLDITQDQKSPSFGSSGNDWNLRFADDMPLDLYINLGAGKQDLQFKNMALRKLDVNVGAGQVDVDLSGNRDHDLNAEIKGGVGQATVRLPKDVGVSVHASGGIGSIDTDGLRKEDGDYVNEAYGKSAATIHLTVQGGIGAIHLIEER